MRCRLPICLAAGSRRPDRPRHCPLAWMLITASLARTAPPDAAFRPPGPTPPAIPRLAAGRRASLRVSHPDTIKSRAAARRYSERCCGMPASRARTSVSRYLRWPPKVRMDVSFPAFAHLVTVFGSTLNIVATSAGVSSGSASGVRADILTASPPGPVLRSCVCDCSRLHWGACRGCPI
jgi:hypothetical protein